MFTVELSLRSINNFAVIVAGFNAFRYDFMNVSFAAKNVVITFIRR